MQYHIATRNVTQSDIIVHFVFREISILNIQDAVTT